jgi:hypothetical protein
MTEDDEALELARRNITACQGALAAAMVALETAETALEGLTARSEATEGTRSRILHMMGDSTVEVDE